MSLYEGVIQSLTTLTLKLTNGITSLEFKGVFVLAILGLISVLAFFAFLNGKRVKKKSGSTDDGSIATENVMGGTEYGHKTMKPRKEEEKSVTQSVQGQMLGTQHGEMPIVADENHLMEVDIRGDPLQCRLELRFKSTQTVKDVRKEVQMRAKLTEKIVLMRRGQILRDDMTLAEAGRDGLAWRAKIAQ